MNRRIRCLAALIALIGFTAYFAESLVASACLPGDGMAAAAQAVAGSHAGSHAGNHHAATAADASDATELPVGSDPVGTHCPLAMPGGSSCTVAITLPPPTTSIQAIDHAYQMNTPLAETAAGQLAFDPFFRPPRR